ncbi:MAG: hypothetical protein QOI65_1170 [Thermoleophilaceae bacterium]|nr:hypothetical protein [Thermoleophilaceae bacterium]
MIRAGGAAALGGLMLVAALAFGAATLFLPAVALLLLAVVSAGWVALAAAGAGLDRHGGPHAVEEEHPWPLVLEPRPGLVRPPGGQLVEPLLGDPLPLGRRRPRRTRIDVRFERRGRRTLEPARLVIADPLGLARRELAADPIELIVLPRIEPVLAPQGGAAGGVVGRAARPVGAAEVEPDALRPYRPGAPAARIHWATVARTGVVMERRLASDADSLPLVVLDPRRPPSEDALDRAVRATASLCVHLARQGGCALMLPGDRRASDIDPDLHAWPALHIRLALVEADDRPPVPGRLERAGSLFWVAAGAGTPPPGLARAAAAQRFLVTPVPSGSAAGSFVVAGCAGRLLGPASRRAA